ncbi:MAG: tripartite tricarboxylate transporter permease [Clostridia bacterium]
MYANIIEAFSSVLSVEIFLLMLIGVTVGIVFGAIPGLSATMALALCLPMTYSMDVIPAMSLLCALFIGGISGGLIPAILMNIPGTPSSIATCFDGNPMAQNGQAGRAIGIAVVFSFLGGIAGFLVLFFIAPPLAKVAIGFGPYEYFGIALFSLTLIATVSGESMVKGLISGLIGMAFALVGPAPIDAYSRFTFGIKGLIGGFDLLTVLIGLFAISEIIKTAENPQSANMENIQEVKIRGFGISLSEFREQVVNFFRSSIIGIAMGILPGIGGSTSSILAYLTAKNSSKHPEKFGTGIIDGIVASESANNATIGGAMVPLLTLGIPGESTTAMLLGAFMLHGLTPGPLLFTKNANLVYSIFVALMIANVIMLILEFYGIRLFIRLLRIPKYFLLPIVLALCVVGAFGLNNNLFDVWTILFFGLIGFAMDKFDIPTAPALLGFILGPMAETNLRSGLMLTNGSFIPFLQRPISCTFIIFAIVSVLFTIVKTVKGGNKQKAHHG